MKNWLMLLVAGTISVLMTAADAQGVAPTISATGQGNWEMICHFVANGDQSDSILGPTRGSYSNPRLRRASCSYKASSSGSLVITISSAGDCPFKGIGADACILMVPKGRAGSFELKVKAAR